MFTIGIGLIGVILTITLNCSSSTWTTIMKSGSFYSIGIAMCSSFVSVFLINIIKNRKNLKEICFLSFKVVCIGFGVVLMTFMASYYSLLMAGGNHPNKIQYIMYALTLFLCIYAFCIENLELHYDDYKDLDDNAVENIKTKAKKTTTDGGGIKI